MLLLSRRLVPLRSKRHQACDSEPKAHKGISTTWFYFINRSTRLEDMVGNVVFKAESEVVQLGLGSCIRVVFNLRERMHPILSFSVKLRLGKEYFQNGN